MIPTINSLMSVGTVRVTEVMIGELYCRRVIECLRRWPRRSDGAAAGVTERQTAPDCQTSPGRVVIRGSRIGTC
jgi:hypothetical protein